MSDKSKIEWTDASWNPTRGCSRVSDGCTRCYAERVAMRFSGPGQPYEGLVRRVNGKPTWTGAIRLVPNMLMIPLGWKKPRMIFVDSMSDLFHADVPFDYIDKVFAIMAVARQHTFQVLTKRADRMAEYIDSRSAMRIHAAATDLLGYDNPKRLAVNDWPLRNVWLGISAENQSAANERIPLLLATAAAVRWVSAEPLLGNINLTRIKIGSGWYDALNGWRDRCPDWGGRENLLHWVVSGGESGPGARPSHPTWFRNLRDQCAAAGVPFHHKQNGTFIPDRLADPNDVDVVVMDDGLRMSRVTKKIAGRLLDDIEHNGFPTINSGE